MIYNNILYALNDTIYIHNLKKEKANGIKANGIKIRQAGPIKNPFGYLVSDDGYIYVLRMSEFSIFESKVKCSVIYNDENKIICADSKLLKTYAIKEYRPYVGQILSLFQKKYVSMLSCLYVKLIKYCSTLTKTGISIKTSSISQTRYTLPKTASFGLSSILTSTYLPASWIINLIYMK